MISIKFSETHPSYEKNFKNFGIVLNLIQKNTPKIQLWNLGEFTVAKQ